MPKTHPAPRPAPADRARPTESLARLAVESCRDLKAKDVLALDLAGVTDMTDYFVIATGTSDTHVRSIAEHVLEGMAAAGHRAAHTDGLQQGGWVVLDFVHCVVHVFHPTLREYYQLERLWGDAQPLTLDAPGAA
jgi:ribosome-associated protein